MQLFALDRRWPSDRWQDAKGGREKLRSLLSGSRVGDFTPAVFRGMTRGIDELFRLRYSFLSKSSRVEEEKRRVVPNSRSSSTRCLGRIFSLLGPRPTVRTTFLKLIQVLAKDITRIHFEDHSVTSYLESKRYHLSWLQNSLMIQCHSLLGLPLSAWKRYVLSSFDDCPWASEHPSLCTCVKEPEYCVTGFAVHT